MPVLSQEERIAAEKAIREKLGLPMMGANPTNSVSDETLQIEREILGVQAYGFGEIWSRPGLSIEDRCFITLSVLTTTYQHAPLADYVRASIRVGIKPADILDAMMHTGVYAGITAASEAMNVARAVFTELGITKPREEEITPVYPMNREDRLEGVARIVRDVGIGRKGLGPDRPPFAYLKSGVWTEKAKDLPVEEDFNQINGEYGYGENWGRPTLGYRIRSLITIASLQAQFANDQLHFHLNNAVNLGISGEEIHEVLAHVGIYCGGANWRNAANVARDIFLQRGIVEPA
jgi:4-carboxymuconolactone decarboxylase